MGVGGGWYWIEEMYFGVQWCVVEQVQEVCYEVFVFVEVCVDYVVFVVGKVQCYWLYWYIGVECGLEDMCVEYFQYVVVVVVVFWKYCY